MTTFRKERVAEVLLVFLGEQIRRLQDPRLGFLTITDLDISPDLKVAKVFWTIHPGKVQGEGGILPVATKEDIAAGEAALKGIAGLLKRRIGEELKLRYVPQLLFRYDESIDRGMRIDYLLNKVHAQ
jgi:ribosome-binding factor A